MIKHRLAAWLFALLFVAALSRPAAAETITCTECGMKWEASSRYVSRIVQGDKIFYFCDIGDLLTYLNKKKSLTSAAGVKDFTSGEWLEFQKAYYVHDAKKFNSPMGWGFASFKGKKEASGYGTVMDSEGALKAVR